MDSKLMKYVPAKLRGDVRDIYRDDDGYWCVFKTATYDGGHTAHEDNITDLKLAFKNFEF